MPTIIRPRLITFIPSFLRLVWGAMCQQGHCKVGCKVAPIGWSAAADRREPEGDKPTCGRLLSPYTISLCEPGHAGEQLVDDPLEWPQCLFDGLHFLLAQSEARPVWRVR